MTNELAEARAARGLPPYRDERVLIKPLAPPPERGNTMKLCPWCKEEFPASEFKAAGTAFSNPPCGACFKERYGKTQRYTCGTCAVVFESRKRGQKDCNRCTNRKRKAAPRPKLEPVQRSCIECGGDLVRANAKRCPKCAREVGRARTAAYLRERVLTPEQLEAKRQANREHMRKKRAGRVSTRREAA